MAQHLVHRLHRHGEKRGVDAEHEHPNHFLPSCSHRRAARLTAGAAFAEADVAPPTRGCVVFIPWASCWPRPPIALTAPPLVSSAPPAPLALLSPRRSGTPPPPPAPPRP